MGGDQLGQGGGPPASVPRPQGQAQGPHPEPRPAGGEVAGQFAEGGEADDRRRRSQADAVEAGTAHHPDPPTGLHSGPQDGQRVVAHRVVCVHPRAGSPRSAAPRPRGDRLRPGSTPRSPTRGSGSPSSMPASTERRPDGRPQRIHGAVQPRELVVGTRPRVPCPGPSRRVDQPDVGLRGPTVDGQDELVGHAAVRSPLPLASVTQG